MNSTTAEGRTSLAFLLSKAPCIYRTNYDTSSEDCSPLTYTALPAALAERAVRLCVLPLEDSQAVVQSAGEVTEAVKSLLPAGEHLQNSIDQGP